jgi:hypothetical protein
MHTVDRDVAEKLWERSSGEFAFAVQAFVARGAARQKGKSAKEVLAEALIEVVKAAYKAGLNHGYDMGASVVGDRDDRSDQ